MYGNEQFSANTSGRLANGQTYDDESPTFTSFKPRHISQTYDDDNEIPVRSRIAKDLNYKLKSNSNDLRDLIDNNELVIISPIRANTIKVCKITCNNCVHNPGLKRDVKHYRSLVQSAIVILVVILLSVNVYAVSQAYNQSLDKCIANNKHLECKFELDTCYINMIVVSLIVINFFTVCLMCYQTVLVKKNSTARFDDWMFVFLSWSGGWIVAWPLLFVFNLRKYFNCRFLTLKPNSLLVVIFSVTSLIFFIIY